MLAPSDLLRPRTACLCLLGALGVVGALASGTASAQDPDDGDAPAEPVATYPLNGLDIVVRTPTGLDDGWAPPPWMINAEDSLALQKKGQQLVALIEVVQRTWQPKFTAEDAETQGKLLATAFLDSTYAGPELGTIDWESVRLVEDPYLGTSIRADALVELPELAEQLAAEEGKQGRLTVLLFPIRDGHDAIAIVGVADPLLMDTAVTELTSMVAFYDGPRKWKDMPTGTIQESAGYAITLPEGWRALAENERLGINGEPVGGNSGYGGALALQYFLDPTDVTGRTGFGCAAWSSETLEVVDPDKAPGLGDNYRLAARLMLKGGAYQVDGGKPIRGRNADMLDSRSIVIDPDEPGELTVMSLGDRDAYLWQVSGTKTEASGSSEPVDVLSWYTAYSDVNLHCHVDAPAGQGTALLDAFRTAMATVSIDDAEQHPMEMGLMARYRRWWPSTNPILQLYWLPIPVILFAGILARGGDD